MPNPNVDLISYVSAGLAAGKTSEELRAELKTAGWADADVEAAFDSSSGLPTKSVSRLPWKWLVIGFIALAAIAAGVAAFLIFGKNLTGAPATNLTNSPAVNSPSASAENSPVVNSLTNTNSSPQDDSSINDSGLALYAVNVPTGDNAYMDVAALKSVTDKSDVNPSGDIKKQLSGEDAWDQKFVDDILKKNKQLIAAFAEAVLKPGFQVPEYSDPQTYDSAKPTVDFGSIVKLVNILELDAMATAKGGDVSDAAGEGFAIALYGQKMITSQINETGYLVGINIKKAGLDSLNKIISSTTLSPTLAGQINSALASFSDTAPPLANVYKFSYWINRNKLENIIKDPAKYYPDIALEKFSEPFFFEPNKTINMMGDAVRSAIAMTKDACHEFSDPTTGGKDNVELEKMDTENGFGKFFASSLQTGWAESLNARCADAALVASVRATLVSQAGGQ